MKKVRCACGKIVCEVNENKVVIRCRHCKREVTIVVQGPVVVNDAADNSEMEVVDNRIAK